MLIKTAIDYTGFSDAAFQSPVNKDGNKVVHLSSGNVN